MNNMRRRAPTSGTSRTTASRKPREFVRYAQARGPQCSATTLIFGAKL